MSGLCLVWVSSNSKDNSATDTSDAPFTIIDESSPGTLTVVTPNGGETLAAGSFYEITWTSTGSVNNVLGAKGTGKNRSPLSLDTIIFSLLKSV